MNVQELETARRLNTPFVTIGCVDGGSGSIRWKQEWLPAPPWASDFGNPDFARLAESFGLPGTISRAGDFALTLEQGAHAGPADGPSPCP